MDKKKKSRKRMPSAPIKAPASNVKGVGKMGLFTGGEVPTVIAPVRGLTGAQVVSTFMRGYNSKTKGKGK